MQVEIGFDNIIFNLGDKSIRQIRYKVEENKK